MTSLANNLVRFLASEDGPTAVEYAVLLGVMMAVLISAFNAGQNLNRSFSSSATSVSAAFKGTQ